MDKTAQCAKRIIILIEGKFAGTTFTSFCHAASIQSVCANNWPQCVYYLLSHLCYSLSSCSFTIRGTCAFTVHYNCDSRLPNCDFTATRHRDRNLVETEKSDSAVTLAAVKNIALRDERAPIERGIYPARVW